MKTKYFILCLFLHASIAQATDWDTLIEQSPSAKRERLQLDDKGYVVADVAKLASGKMRFLGFSTFRLSLKPKLTIESKQQDLQTACNLGVLAGAPFKAKLEMQTNAAASLQTGLFGVGSKLNQFENSVKVGKAVLSFSKKKVAWSLYDSELAVRQNTISDYYLDVLNTQLKDAGDGKLEVDLSKMNAFACDLAFGNLVIQVEQTVDFEVGLPSQVIWVGLEQYKNIYRSFWKTAPILKGDNANENLQLEAMALGVSAAPHVKAEELLKSSTRMQKFLRSMKVKIENFEPIQKTNISSSEVMVAWRENTEYVKPSVETTRETISVLNEPVFVKILN